MRRSCFFVAIGVLAIAAGCGGGRGPTAPTPRSPRISRTRFLAFGDSITAGEVTAPIALAPGHGQGGGIGRLVLVPTASYPSVLKSQLMSAYASQAGSITVENAGVSNEPILDGVVRFDEMFPSTHAEVVLLQEGVNGLNFVGPDTSTGLMRIMVQRAKNENAKVFVGSMIPTVPGRPRATVSPAALVTYDNVLQSMCAQEGVTYVNLYDGMLADAATLIGPDGLHPTEAGYRRIADLFFAAITSELAEK
jgi:lysophospholipase L1-like esterase